MGIASEVRAEAAYQKLTHEDLAERMGVARATVTRKLAGERRFTEDDIEAFSLALNVPAWELMRRAAERQVA